MSALSDTYLDVDTLVGSALEDLDSIDLDMVAVAQDEAAADTHNRMENALASVRRALAAIRFTVRTADDTPKAAE